MQCSLAEKAPLNRDVLFITLSWARIRDGAMCQPVIGGLVMPVAVHLINVFLMAAGQFSVIGLMRIGGGS